MADCLKRVGMTLMMFVICFMAAGFWAWMLDVDLVLTLAGAALWTACRASVDVDRGAQP